MLALCAQDASFGPGSICRSLDFTVTFEQAILSILPDSITLFLAAVSIYRSGLPRRPLINATSRLLHGPWATGERILLAKLLLNTSLLIAQVSALVAAICMATRSTSIPAGEPTTLVIVAKSLSVMVAVVRYPLELCLHTSSPAPSTLLLSASFLNAIFSGTILRTFSLTLDTRQPAQLSLFASQAIITALASLQTLLSTARHTSLHSQTLQDQAEGAASSPKDHPDLIRGLLARAFVLWHFPLLRRGFRAKLTYGDLYTSPPRVQAHALARLFEYH